MAQTRSSVHRGKRPPAKERHICTDTRSTGDTGQTGPEKNPLAHENIDRIRKEPPIA